MNISLLKQGDKEKIMKLTEEAIEKTGFIIENEELRTILSKNGAVIDEISGKTTIPGDVLREYLSLVPSSYTIRGLDNEERKIGGGEQYLSAIVTDPWIIDYQSRKVRRPGLDDVLRNTILSQKNPKVASIGRMDFPVTEYADAHSSNRALELHLLNHTKHYNVYTACMEDLWMWMDIGQIMLQGKKLKGSGLMSVAVAVVSPFILPDFNCRALMVAAEKDLTVIPTICPMAGTTSPYSLDGTLLQGNIENIFLAAITQMVNPGNPFLYAFGPSISDMRTGHDMYYTVEKVLWKIAATELAKAYDMPCSAECGGTLGAGYDMQSGAESMLFMLTAQNPGADILAGVGSCYNANGLSSEMIVMQSEWFEMASYLSKGIDTGNMDKSLISIIEQGPGGNFLMDDTTIENLRSSEFYSPRNLDMSGGYREAPSMLQNAHERVIELTRNYESPVPESIQEDIRRFFKKIYDT